jgi:hypothetical protein
MSIPTLSSSLTALPVATTSPNPVQFTIQRISLEDLKLSPMKFWEQLYVNYIKPEPGCDFCNKTIDDPKEWVAFTCKCPKYYHRKCVYQRLEALVCPHCNECKDIYTLARFPKKFVDREKYIDIYQRSVTNLDPSTQLMMYEYWFNTHDVYTPPLLDLYTYLEPHNPNKTLDYMNHTLVNYLIESYDPAISVKPNEDGESVNVTYHCEKISYVDQKMFVDIDSFKKKFRELCYDMVGDDFPWSDTVLLVGGTVHKCLESRIQVEDIPEYCDVDIFIVHSDISVITKEAKRVIKYFENRLGSDIYWVVRRNIINVYVPGYNRSIQIIMYLNKIENILHKFDFSHIQYAYNGKQMLTTLAGLKYASLLISVHSGYYDVTFPKRYYKAKQMKLCLALPIDKALYFTIPKIVKLEYFYPTYMDNLEMIQTQLKNIYKIPKKYITKGKPFKVFYSKIPTDFANDRLCSNCHSFVSDGEVVSFMEEEVLVPPGLSLSSSIGN